MLRIGVPGSWGQLTPAHQHTVYAAAIIQNQFEPLVWRGPNGILEPHAAISWDISQDFRIFRFQLDRAKRFSDGTTLSAYDFKQSWERGLKEKAEAANNVLGDILYKVVGFKDFEKTGNLEGIKVIDEATLEVEFEKPFRTAMEQFSVEYLAPQRIVNGQHLGTGPYVISQPDRKTVELSLNSFFKGAVQPKFEKVSFISLSQEECIDYFESGKIDVVTFAQRIDFERIQKIPNVGQATGQEVSHYSLTLNGLSGRLFENPNHRRAFQAAVWKALKSNPLPKSLSGFQFQLDSQTFLKAQAGRVSDTEATQFIEIGETHIPRLAAATNITPLKFITSEPTPWLADYLAPFGIMVDQSANAPVSRLVEDYYRTFESDIVAGTHSVMNGDPDGVFHFLGNRGAIASPMAHRAEVSDLLDVGRDLLGTDKIHKHYQKVSRSILSNVPNVHLGFLSEVIIYSKDRIRLNPDLMARHNYSLLVYEQK